MTNGPHVDTITYRRRGTYVPAADGSWEQRKSRRKQRKVSSGMRWMALSSLAVADHPLLALECECECECEADDSSSATAIACAASPVPSEGCCCCCCLGLAERLSCLCIFEARASARWPEAFGSAVGAGALNKCSEKVMGVWSGLNCKQ